MSTAAIAPIAAPIIERNSDHCIITLDLDQLRTNNGLMTTHYNIWVGSLWRGDLTYGEYEQVAFECGNSSTIRERDALIQSLKFQARAMGYKRCEVRDPTSVISDGALRATRPKAKAGEVAA